MLARLLGIFGRIYLQGQDLSEDCVPLILA